MKYMRALEPDHQLLVKQLSSSIGVFVHRKGQAWVLIIRQKGY